MPALDHIVTFLLPVLAVWFLVSGLDDLFVDFVWAAGAIARRVRGRGQGIPSVSEPEPRIAIFIPLWREEGVIGRMLEHNLAAIRYSEYEVFAGAYPNDVQTLEALRVAAARFPKVHIAVCPHDGPTSKADCLNWVYREMLAHEQRLGIKFDVVVVHDAEDLVDPEELRTISSHAPGCGMVQIPVLPLRTPVYKLTHGVYCDEFAESHTKDMTARASLGSFIPSAGVGTGYARAALERLGETQGNRVFDPACLTEDYDNGLRLHRLGCTQRFVPVRFEQQRPVATREYFPQRFRQALRQRTRWTIGNALQAWQRHGWGRRPHEMYWFWRDRKGLAGNPASALSSLIFAYGTGTWLWARHTGSDWGLGASVHSPLISAVLLTTLALQIHRLSIRAFCSGRIYGCAFAAGVPIRAIWANWLNCAASVAALASYSSAMLRRRPLPWLKTDHVYPSTAALMPHKRPLGELLTIMRLATEDEVRRALADKPAGFRLGEHMVSRGVLTQTELYSALSAQQNVPFTPLDEAAIPRWVARALPGAVARRCRVLPFRVSDGKLHVAGPEIPKDETVRELSRYTPLEIRFQYITPSDYERLTEHFLSRQAEGGKNLSARLT